MKACVVGGAGFLGSHLVDKLLSEGYEVSIFDQLKRSGKPNDRVEFIQGNISDNRDVEKIKGVDIIYHVAAVCGVDVVLEEPESVMEDFFGNHLIFNRAKELGHKRIVFFSTGEIYGDDAMDATEEQDVKIWNTHVPRSVYSLSKLSSEMDLALLKGIESIIIRPFNVYGPRQRGVGVLRNFMERALTNRPLEVYNEGTEIRAMCYIDDFIDGVYKAATLDFDEVSTTVVEDGKEVRKIFVDEKNVFINERSVVFNLGNPYTAMTVRGLAETVKKLTNSNSEIIHRPVEHADKKGVTPNITRAKKLLDYNPQVRLEEGILKSLDWYREAIADGTIEPYRVNY